MSRSRTTILVAAATLAVAAAWWLVAGAGDSASTQATTLTTNPTSDVDPESGLRWISAAALPPEGRATLALVASGGPFPYDRDGAVFGNREGILPQEPRGYYREYTVATPGSDDRGARRIVAGASGERYYTEDHYRSFRRIGP